MRAIERRDKEIIKLVCDISKEAVREKHFHNPLVKGVVWWSIKPLIVSRMVGALYTFDKDVNVEKIMDALCFGRDKLSYNYDPKFDGGGVKVLDPFVGSGSLVFELSRAGMDLYTVEYNPVAWLIEKVIFEYINKYRDLASDVKYYGGILFEKLRESVGCVFGDDDLMYIYSWCIRCPYCFQRFPLVHHSWLSQREKIAICVKSCGNDFGIEIVNSIGYEEGKKYTVKRGNVYCIRCKRKIERKYVVEDIARNRDCQMICVIKKKDGKKVFEVPREEDKAKVEIAKKMLSMFDLDDRYIPMERISQTEHGALIDYGFNRWNEIYTTRQLLYFGLFVKYIKDIHREIEGSKGKEYADVVVACMCLVFMKYVNRCTISVAYDSKKVIYSTVLSLRRPRLLYVFSEVNLFVDSMQRYLDSVVRFIEFVGQCKVKGKINFGSVVDIPYKDKYFDLVVTDPPFGDYVNYGVDSMVFYVWLRRLLGDYYKEFSGDFNFGGDLLLNYGLIPSRLFERQRYITMLVKAMKEIHRVMKDDGLLVLFFANSNYDIWNALVKSLRESGFEVCNWFVVNTEMKTGLVMQRKNISFVSTCVFVCKKKVNKVDVEFDYMMDELRRIIYDSLDKYMCTVDNLKTVDVLNVVHCCVVEIMSKYTDIKHYGIKDIVFEYILKRVADDIVKYLSDKKRKIEIGRTAIL